MKKSKHLPVKKTILIVEDDDAIEIVTRHHASAHLTGCDIVTARTFEEAVHVLCDKDLNIGGVILDNGFPIVEGGERKGMIRITPNDNRAVEDLRKGAAEGGAGAMLLRFMRCGDAMPQSDSSKAEIAPVMQWAKEALGDVYDARMQGLQTVPVVWNSVYPEPSKVDAVRFAAKGEVAHDATYANDSAIAIQEGHLLTIDDHTRCSCKMQAKSIKAMVNFLKEELDKKKGKGK